MNPQKHINENKQLENEEIAINEPNSPYGGLDVAHEGFKTTHEMSNDEKDHIAPVV